MIGTVSPNTEMERFNAIKNRYFAKYLRYQNNRWYLEDVKGDILEKLVALAFERLKWRVARRKTRGVDMLIEKGNNPSKNIALEATNWEIYSVPHTAYSTNKIDSLLKLKNLGYVPLWIMTFLENFKEEVKMGYLDDIEIIETRKQLLPQSVNYDDYKDLKRLIREKLKELKLMK